MRALRAVVVITCLSMMFAGCRKPTEAPAGTPAAGVGPKAGPKIRVAMLEGIRGVDNAEARKQGFEKAVKEWGQSVEIAAMETANWSLEEGEQVCANILTAHPDVKGIFCANDMMALGAIRAIAAAGKTGEILVTAYDNLSEAQQEILAGKLTATIEQHPYFMGDFGVASAVKVLEGEKVPEEVRIPVELIDKQVLLKQQEEFAGAENLMLAVEASRVGAARSEALGEIPKPSKPYRIGLIMKTLSNPFFKTMQQGAEAAAKEFGVDLRVQTGQKETSYEQQANIVLSMVAQKMDAILIAPADSKVLVSPLVEANKAGIPVINLDNRLDPQTVKEEGLKLVTFIGPDNVEGAYLSSKYLLEHLVPAVASGD